MFERENNINLNWCGHKWIIKIDGCKNWIIKISNSKKLKSREPHLIEKILQR